MAKRCELTGVGVMTGNKVSHSKRRTRRTFLPNLQKVALSSEALGNDVGLRITARTLKTVNKYGDLDAFVLNYRYEKLTDEGKKLRRKIEKSLEKKGTLEQVKIAKTKNTKVKKDNKRTLKRKAAEKDSEVVA